MNPFEIRIPENLKKPLWWTVCTAFAALVFSSAMVVSLPTARIQDRIESAVSDALGAKVHAEEFGLAVLGGPGVKAGNVKIESRPNPGEKPSLLTVDDVTVRLGVLGLWRGYTDARWKTHVAGGKITGHVAQKPDGGDYVLDASHVGLASFPQLGAWIGAPGIPLGGALDLSVDVTTPKNQFAEANGSIELKLVSGVVGDGKAKLVVASNPMLASGLTIPKVQLGTLEATVTVEKGKAVLKGVKSHSPDLDVELQGFVDLRDPVSLSQLHLYLLLKPSDALLKREPSLDAMVTMGGAAAKRTDGYFGVSITGPASSPMVLGMKDTPAGLSPVATKLPGRAATAGGAPHTFPSPPGVSPPAGPRVVMQPSTPPPATAIPVMPPPPRVDSPPGSPPGEPPTAQPVAAPSREVPLGAPPARVNGGFRGFNAAPGAPGGPGPGAPPESAPGGGSPSGGPPGSPPGSNDDQPPQQPPPQQPPAENPE